MSKRATIVGVLGVMLMSLYGGDASAHYLIIGGRYVYHSLGCEALVKSVQNQTQHPAQFECNTTVTEVQVLCENPANHNVAPGSAATQEALVALSEVDWDSLVKEKGKATVEADVSTDPLLKPEYCVNPNWTPIEVLVTGLTGTLSVNYCTGIDDPNTPEDETCDSTEPHSSYSVECYLPDQYTVTDPPPDGEPYVCTTTDAIH